MVDAKRSITSIGRLDIFLESGFRSRDVIGEWTLDENGIVSWKIANNRVKGCVCPSDEELFTQMAHVVHGGFAMTFAFERARRRRHAASSTRNTERARGSTSIIDWVRFSNK